MKEVRAIRFDDVTMKILENTGNNVSETVREAVRFYLENRDRISPEKESYYRKVEKLAQNWTILAEKAPEEAKTDIKQGNIDNLMLVNLSYKGGKETENVKRIKEMLPFFHISFDDLMKLICDGLESGDVSISKKKLDIVTEYRLDELIETCQLNHVNPGRAIHILERYVKEGKITCNS